VNEKDKLLALKEYYLSIEHPFWKREEWVNKVTSIFQGSGGENKKFSIEEWYIRQIERCYTAPRRFYKFQIDSSLYMKSGKEKEELKEKIEFEENERIKIFKQRVNERLKWYNSL
jgi:hypothetical protein